MSSPIPTADMSTNGFIQIGGTSLATPMWGQL